IQSADDRDRILPWFQRLQYEWKFREFPWFHCPMRGFPAVWIEDTNEPRSLSRGLCLGRRRESGKHRFQQRQRYGCACALQEPPARNMLFRDEHVIIPAEASDSSETEHSSDRKSVV